MRPFILSEESPEETTLIAWVGNYMLLCKNEDRAYNDHNMQLPAKEKKMREYKILRFTRSDVLFFCKTKGISPEYLIVELMKEINFH